MNILEAIYYSIFIYKKNKDLKKQKRLSHPVISIGNISMGGTGKTPLAIALANEAVKRGYRPCILTRGYKRKTSSKVQYVSMGSGAMSNYLELGDEPVLMAQRTQGVEIIVGADRYIAGILSKDANLFILDDGFQHWRLYRDIDIVLINTLEKNKLQKLLPFGSLREPMSSCSRADIIIKTQGNKSHQEILNEINIPIFYGYHMPTYLINLTGKREDIDRFKGAKVFAFAGIGSPKGFMSTLGTMGFDIAGYKIFRDHHPYSPFDIVKLIKKAQSLGAECLLTTEKDLLKIPFRWAEVCHKGEHERAPLQNIYAVGIDFIIDKGFYDMVFSKIKSQGDT